jgi:hypothetical protein
LEDGNNLEVDWLIKATKEVDKFEGESLRETYLNKSHVEVEIA